MLVMVCPLAFSQREMKALTLLLLLAKTAISAEKERPQFLY